MIGLTSRLFCYRRLFGVLRVPCAVELGFFVSTAVEDVGFPNCGGVKVARFPDGGAVEVVGCPDYTGDSPKFVGSIPELVFTNLAKLEYLTLSSNSFQGLLSSNISKLLKLKDLGLGNNQFVGSIPEEIGLLSDLQFISLANNSFQGKIPSSIGPIPPTIWNLTNLESLNLFDNYLNGTITPQIGNLKLLTAFDLSKNQLNGEIPPTICNLSSLVVLNLSNNSFINTIPQCLGNFSHELSVLDLRMNRFRGTVPANFSKFGGAIDTSTCKLPFPKLRIIDLSHNEFTGPLPAEYFKNFKAVMNVDEHKVGRECMGEKNNYYRDSVKVVVKGLELERTRILTIFTTIDLSGNNFQGEIPDFIGMLHRFGCSTYLTTVLQDRFHLL
ncbi:receptor-like protein 43 [Cornus florida]|uniref:receptor-like protein 43 n=1 Tax=Cornus florida TaxID=4283 RepID=UPI00289DCA7D|nr:receptor-like protein 43 [Cornus florida]